MSFNPNFGFIIARHVNSEKTNDYWNRCVKCIRRFYPHVKIVIIDDNSKKEYIKSEFEYKNIEIIESQFPKRGELLPYYYFLKRQFFENAVIIHDSVFFHKRISFETFSKIGILAMPLWHFEADQENVGNTIRISSYLKNNDFIQKSLLSNDFSLSMAGSGQKWCGMFGVQSYVNLRFLKHIDDKYDICNMINSIGSRPDRCCLERIMGCLVFTELNRLNKLKKFKSLFGNIHNWQRWGYSHEEYVADLKNKKIPKEVIKIWTGR